MFITVRELQEKFHAVAGGALREHLIITMSTVTIEEF
jgi:hypothetical protein